MKQNMLWNTAGNFVYLMLQWLITIVIVRLTGYYEAGLYALAMSVTNVCYSVAVWGMRTYQVSDVKEKYSDLEYIYSRAITCVIALLGCLVFIYANKYTLMQRLVILVYMLFRNSEAFVDVLHGITQKRSRMDFVGKSFLLRGISNFLVFFVSLFLLRNLLVSVILMTVTSLLFVVFYDFSVIKSFTDIVSDISIKKIKKLLVETLPLALYLLMSTAVASIPRYRLEDIMGTDILGIYASIATPVVIIQAATSFLMAPITTPLAEYLEQGEKVKFYTLIRNTFLALTGIFVVATIGCKLMGAWGLELLFGRDILKYEYILMPVVLCVITVSISWFVNMILTVVRAFRGLIISNLIAIVITVLSSSLFIMQFGINGTSYVTALALVIQIVIACFFLFLNLQRHGWKSEN